MIEVKGKFEDLIKRNIGPKGLELDMSYNSISKYSVNGAIHYAYAILSHTYYDKVIAIGITGNINKILVWSYLVTREEIKFLKDVSNKNDLSYLTNLKEVIKNV